MVQRVHSELHVAASLEAAVIGLPAEVSGRCARCRFVAQRAEDEGLLSFGYEVRDHSGEDRVEGAALDGPAICRLPTTVSPAYGAVDISARDVSAPKENGMVNAGGGDRWGEALIAPLAGSRDLERPLSFEESGQPRCFDRWDAHITPSILLNTGIEDVAA